MSDRPSLEDEPLETLIDEIWPYHQPPPGFAARVLAAQKARGATPTRRWPRWRGPLVVSLGGLAAAALVLVLVRAGGGGRVAPADGQLRADDRQTVRIDQRALAVA